MFFFSNLSIVFQSQHDAVSGKTRKQLARFKLSLPVFNNRNGYVPEVLRITIERKCVGGLCLADEKTRKFFDS